MKDKLAIIVPYRDREEHLNIFVPHMHQFLKDKGISYDIFIAEQTDDRPFNYGKLCNVVTKEIGEEYTYFAFHDIDMLPISDECDYSFPDSPTHLATNVEAHDDKLPYPQYFGGVVLISREDFEKANGYSTEYWGYGFHDIDLLYRLQRSGAYLEKYQDLNQTYSRYDEDDILPYRIENVKISSNKKINPISFCNFEKNDYIRGVLNPFTLDTINSDFFVSFWFNDAESDVKKEKNIFSFEGFNTGVFLSSDKYLMYQVWNNSGNHFELNHNYYKNKWNHVIFGISDDKFFLYLNNLKVEKNLPNDFTLFNYQNRSIKISDENSKILLSEIKIFKSKINDNIVSELYFIGDSSIQSLENKFGLNVVNDFRYDKIYRKNILLDSGKNLNHLNTYGNINTNFEKVETSDDIYLPFRLPGEYKSLAHKNDTDIINNYYTYNPDIIENSDIFFHEVLPNKLEYTAVGLSNLKYKILDKKNENHYQLIRIVT
jgi:hypothetical protein